MSNQLPRYETQNMYISETLRKKGYYITSEKQKTIKVYESAAKALLSGEVDADLIHFSSQSFSLLDATNITRQMKEKLYEWAVEKEFIFYEDYFCFVYELLGIETEWFIRASEIEYEFSPVIPLKKFMRVNKAFPTPKFVAESPHSFSNTEDAEELFQSILFAFALENGFLGIWRGEYGDIAKIDVRTPALNLKYL